MRIGLGRALHGVVLGEMFSSNAGLGYRITFYAAHLRTADVFVPLVILVVIGLLINQLGNAVEARLQACSSSSSPSRNKVLKSTVVGGAASGGSPANRSASSLTSATCC